jgi:hypothetical protein
MTAAGVSSTCLTAPCRTVNKACTRVSSSCSHYMHILSVLAERVDKTHWFDNGLQQLHVQQCSLQAVHCNNDTLKRYLLLLTVFQHVHSIVYMSTVNMMCFYSYYLWSDWVAVWIVQVVRLLWSNT